MAEFQIYGTTRGLPRNLALQMKVWGALLGALFGLGYTVLLASLGPLGLLAGLYLALLGGWTGWRTAEAGVADQFEGGAPTLRGCLTFGLVQTVLNGLRAGLVFALTLAVGFLIVQAAEHLPHGHYGELVSFALLGFLAGGLAGAFAGAVNGVLAGLVGGAGAYALWRVRLGRP